MAARGHGWAAIASIASVFVAAAVVAGCGSDATPAAPRTPSTDSAAATEPAPPDTQASSDVDAVAPTRQALAAGRRFDALLAAYAPIRDRINFLVAADTLRIDAIESGAGVEIQRERTGIVRVEAARLRRIVVAARAHVAAVSIGLPAEQQVQRSMLQSIDARIRAIDALTRAVQARTATAPDTRVDALEDLWTRSWSDAARGAREATTTMQVARAALGLEPAPEESIR